MVESPSRKSAVLVWIGRSLMAVSFVFIAFRLWNYRHSFGVQIGNPKLLFSTIFCSGVYALSEFFLAFGWWRILGSRAGWGKGLKWQSAWRVYGKTQIAKYIPGNIFHFAGRHVVAAKEGASHASLVTAATGEIIMMLLASILISLLAIEILLEKIPHHSLSIGILIGCAFIGLFIMRIFSRRFGFRNIIRGIEWRNILEAQISYFSFFAISILLFFSLLLLESGPVSNWTLIAGAYALAWAISFVVPGAPGGLGVREAMLVTFLSGALEEKTILITAILFRIVTTVGDVLFFLISGAKRR